MKGIIVFGILLFSLSALFMLNGCIIPNNSIDQNIDGNFDQNIGGQRDAQGCLVGAGYSYDSMVGACIRPWELNDEEKIYASQAVDQIGAQYGLTINKISDENCEDCVVVTLVKNDFSREEVIVPVEMIDVDLNYDSDQNVLFYSFTIDMPTPCYIIEKEELILESYPVQVVVNVELIPLQTFAACAQVITPQDVNGAISIDHLPGSFSVYQDAEGLDRKLIFRTNTILQN